MSDGPEEIEVEDPPVLGSWPKVYAFVLIFLLCEILLFYWFSQHYA